MSRLLKDATKANAAGRTVMKPVQEAFDEFEDEFDTQPKPIETKQPTRQPYTSKTFDDIPFDPKAFSKDFFATLEDFGNLRKAIPDDLTSFSDYDKFQTGCLPEIRLEIRLEMESISQQLQDTYSKIRQLEFSAENAVKMNKDRALIYGILFDRKDLQNKAALLTSKKIKLLDLKERLEAFEMFSELSRDFGTYQKITNAFVNEHKVYFPEEDLDTRVQMSLAFNHTHLACQGFQIDKEPIHDYHLIELPQSNSQLKELIEREYVELLRNCSR
jgi:hypothetical protein